MLTLLTYCCTCAHCGCTLCMWYMHFTQLQKLVYVVFIARIPVHMLSRIGLKKCASTCHQLVLYAALHQHIFWFDAIQEGSCDSMEQMPAQHPQVETTPVSHQRLGSSADHAIDFTEEEVRTYCNFSSTPVFLLSAAHTLSACLPALPTSRFLVRQHTSHSKLRITVQGHAQLVLMSFHHSSVGHSSCMRPQHCSMLHLRSSDHCVIRHHIIETKINESGWMKK